MMFRFFYRWLLRFHPARFRERFAEEMLSIFDHVETKAAAANLVVEALYLAGTAVDHAVGILERTSSRDRVTRCGRFAGLFYIRNLQAAQECLVRGCSSDLDCVFCALFRT
jgi:hypothetical protein